MASSVTKQQYYRRLMKEQKSKAAGSQQTKITHPLARWVLPCSVTITPCPNSCPNTTMRTCTLFELHMRGRILVDNQAEISCMLTSGHVVPKPKDEPADGGLVDG